MHNYVFSMYIHTYICTSLPTSTACSDGQLRLMNSTASGEGRIELCINNTYGSVCDDQWGIKDAEVACKQLGFAAERRFIGN